MAKVCPEGGWYCPKCGKQTNKLVGVSDNGDYGCPDCIETRDHRNTALLHLYQNPEHGRLSVAKERVIMNRIKAPDGQIIDRRTGKPTER